jgi:hypothetical protein
MKCRVRLRFQQLSQFLRGCKTLKVHGCSLMSEMVGVSFPNGEGAVDLLEENDAGEFVGKRHLAQREDEVGRAAGSVREAVGGADSEKKRRERLRLRVGEKLGEFFGRKLLATAI